MATTFIALLAVFSAVQGAPPRLSAQAPKDYTGFADLFRSLTCNIEGDDLTFSWFHNDTKIAPDSAMFEMFFNFLFVSQTPVTEKYQGTYQCKASNKDGTLAGPKINVFFSIVGKFMKNDQTVEQVDVTIGKSLSMTCPPILSRNVFYHWGGREGVTGVWFLPKAPHYMIMNDGTLLFANVKDKDLEYFNVKKNGVSCSIESKGATKRLAFSQRFLLREVGEKNTKPFGPEIKTEIQDKEVAKGTEFVVLRCGAIGLPTPKYSWTFTGLSGEEVSITSGENGYELQDFNHLLMVKAIETKHDGLYKCKASSNYGGKEHVDVKSGRIFVKGKPQWLPNGKLSDATADEGREFLWSCAAYGNPNPSYTWLLNGEKLADSDKYNIKGGVLKFMPVSKTDEGLYQCQAENDFGDISSSATLTVKPAPTTPSPPPSSPTPSSSQCNADKINLMFLVDGSGSVPPATFGEFKKFMKLLVDKFTIGPNAMQVAVLQYSTNDLTGLEFYFGEHKTKKEIQKAISKVVYHYGAYTFGGYAMKLTQQIMDNYDRKDAKDIWVLLMDDGVWDKGLARRVSQSVRKSGTKIFVLDTRNIMKDIADVGLKFTSDKVEQNVEVIASEICK